MVHSSRKTYKDRAIARRDLEAQRTEDKASYVDILLTLKRSTECIARVDNISYSLIEDALNLVEAIDAVNGIFGITFETTKADSDGEVDQRPVEARIQRAREIIQIANDVLWEIKDEWEKDSAHKRELNDSKKIMEESLAELKRERREAFVLGKPCTPEMTKRMDKDIVEKDRYTPNQADLVRLGYLSEGLLKDESDDEDEHIEGE